MNIENLEIITGTPEEVKEKAQAYLDAHPNAQILGTAVCVKRGPVIEEPKEEKEPKTKESKKPEVNPATGATPPVVPEPAATLSAVTYGPDETVVSITLGRVF